MIFLSIFAAYINMYMFDAPFLHLNRLFQVQYALPVIYLGIIVINQVVVRMQIGAMM